MQIYFRIKKVKIVLWEKYSFSSLMITHFTSACTSLLIMSGCRWQPRKRESPRYFRTVSPPEDYTEQHTPDRIVAERVLIKRGTSFALLWASQAQLPEWLYTASTSSTEILDPNVVSICRDCSTAASVFVKVLFTIQDVIDMTTWGHCHPVLLLWRGTADTFLVQWQPCSIQWLKISWYFVSLCCYTADSGYHS